MSQVLKGQLALVTGAAGLLGIQHCIALAELGAEVLLSDINFEKAAAAARFISTEMPGSKVSPVVLDVSQENSVRDLYEKKESEGKYVSILVNNAAIDPKVRKNDGLELSRLENIDIDDWNFQINVGLTGAFICSKYFGTKMARMKSGCILNIASDLSIIAPDQRLYRKDGLEEELQPVKPVTYSVIKSGLVGLTKYLASYWAKDGVRVNSLSPGGVFNGQPDTFVEKLVDRIPMGRMAEVDEYRSAIQFLCSQSSSYMTGQNIVMDGGRSII